MGEREQESQREPGRVRESLIEGERSCWIVPDQDSGRERRESLDTVDWGTGDKDDETGGCQQGWTDLASDWFALPNVSTVYLECLAKDQV